MRRILLISAVAVLLIGIGVGIYFIFFYKSATLTATNGTDFPSADQSVTDSETAGRSVQELGVPAAHAGTDIGPRFVRISDRPVALGTVAVFEPARVTPAPGGGTSTPAIQTEADVRVNYVERESGNVYAYEAHARTLTRLSNKTLPGIQDAAWLSDGSLAFVRFLSGDDSNEQLLSFALPASGDGGYFLEPNLAEVITRGTSTLATLLATVDGSSATVSSPSGTNVHTLFTSPIAGLRLAFAGPNYVATTKASAHADGYVFSVDAKTGVFTRVLGPLASLSTLPSPSGKFVLYSYLDRGKVALAMFDMTTHTATRLPLSTLPEKCVWASDSASFYCGVPTSMGKNEPDDWYQGVSAFQDRLWRIDLSGRVANLIVDPKQVGKIDADMVGLSIDRTSDVLTFINRRDGTLYAYDL